MQGQSKTHSDTQKSFDSLRGKLYLAAEPSHLKEGERWAERAGEGKARGCRCCLGGSGRRPQPASVVVLVFELLLLLLLLVLGFVEVFVGGNGHTGDQQHHLAEADLRIPVDIEVLHDFINGGLVLHVLQRKGQAEGKVLSPTAQASTQPHWDLHR